MVNDFIQLQYYQTLKCKVNEEDDINKLRGMATTIMSTKFLKTITDFFGSVQTRGSAALKRTQKKSTIIIFTMASNTTRLFVDQAYDYEAVICFLEATKVSTTSILQTLNGMKLYHL